MPGLDGTGPAGAGRMTGWGQGPCGSDGSMTASAVYGRGMGFRRGTGMRCGLGFGRGFGPGFRAWTASAQGMDAEGLKESLRDQKDYLKARLEAIDKRLETL